MHMDPQLAKLEESDFKVNSIQGADFRHVSLIKMRSHYMAKHDQWTSRRKRAQKEISSFGKEDLRKVLGEKCEAIVRLKCSRLPSKTVVNTVTSTNTMTPQTSGNTPRKDTKLTVDAQILHAKPRQSTSRPNIEAQIQQPTTEPKISFHSTTVVGTEQAPTQHNAQRKNQSTPKTHAPQESVELQKRRAEPEFFETTGCVKARKLKPKAATMALNDALAKFM